MEKQGCQQAHGNGTNIIHSLLHDPRGRAVSIEALMLVEIALLWLIAALGSCRCRSSSRCIRTLVWAVYTLIFLIFTYTIGFMQSSSIKIDLYPVWAVSFFAVLGCTNSITAFELDENKQWTKHYIQLILYYTYVSVILLHMSDGFIATSVTLLFTVTIYKNYMRIHACLLASESWYSSKLLADYMKHEVDSNESRYDPVSLAGYNYLVCWTGARIRSEPPYYQKQFIATENVITIEQIWRCDGRLMKSAGGARLKDVCLSFAFVPFAPATLLWSHDFIFRRLLAREDDYNRAFGVIQVELSFLNVFFFTKYALMYYRERVIFYLTIISVTLTPLVILAVTRARGICHSSSNLTTVEIKNSDIVITVRLCIMRGLYCVCQSSPVATEQIHGVDTCFSLQVGVERGLEQVDVLIHRGVATKLSRYCAYLVVYVPDLLPGHQWDTKTIFDEVEKETREFLGSVRTSQDKYQVMKNLGELEETIFVKGAKLGKQLESITDYSARWKVIADFWSEMILFVAPSDTVRGHIEQLTHGGEFITHLWALLTYAGIVEQHKEKQNV
ncbi:uncharacterized protein [Setaria viridis]|uniref:uncharacterized protein n=1 Tax=Setaria viridis TaxID=4556 RepID=UPI003B3A5301